MSQSSSKPVQPSRMPGLTTDRVSSQSPPRVARWSPLGAHASVPVPSTPYESPSASTKYVISTPSSIIPLQSSSTPLHDSGAVGRTSGDASSQSPPQTVVIPSSASRQHIAGANPSSS